MSRTRKSAQRSQHVRRERERLLARGTTDHYQDAELYEFEYSDREDDIGWYRELAEEHTQAGPILELGAGSGRVTRVLAEDGHRVWALDKMEPMLAHLRESVAGEPYAERIEPVLGEMTSIPAKDETFTLVVAPFNGLMHLYRHEQLLACFRETARVLVPGGRFAFDVVLPDLEWLTWDPDKRFAITRFTHPRSGERLVYSTNHTYDPATQVCHIRIYYDRAPPRGQKFRPPAKPLQLVHLAHRQIFPEEIRGLVAQAGLELEAITGDFEGVPLRAGVESQCVLCRKPV